MWPIPVQFLNCRSNVFDPFSELDMPQFSHSIFPSEKLSFTATKVDWKETPLQKKGSEAAFLKRGHRTEKRGLSPIFKNAAQNNAASPLG